MTKRSLESLVDMFWFPLMSTIVIGFVAQFFSQGAGVVYGKQIMVGYVLWETLRIVQYSISIAPMWNIWSHSFSNLFITPISIEEYIFAQFVSGALKSLITLVLNAGALYLFFGFNILSIGIVPLLIFLANIWIFGWALGVIILGIILRVGTKVQAISWGLIYIIQPLTASIFPITILPRSLQSLSRLFPVTYIFDMAKRLVAGEQFDWPLVTTAFMINVIYFTLSLIGFKYLYEKSRESGQLAKNDLQ